MRKVTPINQTVNEIGIIYDRLIEIASKNIGKRVRMDWGNWYPTYKGLEKLISRRIRIKYNRWTRS